MRPFEVLLVEDNLPDGELIRLLLEERGEPLQLHWVRNGQQGSDFLFRRGRYADSPRPDLVLLDLNLPIKDGRELLREVKADPLLRRIPIIVVSTSTSEEEIAEAYSLGAAAFISKPVGLDTFQEIIEALSNFWFRSVALPRRA